VIKSDEGQAIYVLCKEFGYRPDEIGHMTQFQINFLLEGLAEESRRIKREMRKAKRKR